MEEWIDAYYCYRTPGSGDLFVQFLMVLSCLPSNIMEVEMIDLSVYFRNPFSDNTISDINLKKFTEDHLNMMTLNNESGQFTTMIAETIAAYNGYFGTSADKNTTMDVQTQLNQSIRNIFEEFITFVTRQEPEIRNIWGLDSPQYKEFYREGLSEYNNATLVNVETLMTSYINAANNHRKELGQNFIDLLNAIKTNFATAKEAQIRKTTDIHENPNTSLDRNILEKQLMKNLLTFAIAYMDIPDKGMELFNTNLLMRPDEGSTAAPETEKAQVQKEPIK